MLCASCSLAVAEPRSETLLRALSEATGLPPASVYQWWAGTRGEPPPPAPFVTKTLLLHQGSTAPQLQASGHPGTVPWDSQGHLEPSRASASRQLCLQGLCWASRWAWLPRCTLIAPGKPPSTTVLSVPLQSLLKWISFLHVHVYSLKSLLKFIV